MKKKKTHINNAFNYKGSKKEVFTLPSLTIPDQTLSLKDLLARYVRGQDVPTFEPVYIDDETGVPVNFEKMTIQDRLDLAKEVKNRGEALAKKIQGAQKPQENVEDKEPQPAAQEPKKVNSEEAEK